MIPVYSVVAYSGTGKTTLLEKLIPELRKLGLRVAVLKHDAHDFEIDREGKDSYRFTAAGADVTALASGRKAVVMENRPVEPEVLLGMIRDVDLILTEGFKFGDWKKILVARAAAGTGFAVEPDQCFAVASDMAVETAAPVFGLDDAAGLAGYIAADVEREGG